MLPAAVLPALGRIDGRVTVAGPSRLPVAVPVAVSPLQRCSLLADREVTLELGEHVFDKLLRTLSLSALCVAAVVRGPRERMLSLTEVEDESRWE